MKHVFALTLALLASTAFAQSATPVDQGRPNVPEFAPAFPEQTRAPEMIGPAPRVEEFARGLENPWGIAALPDGGVLVTERPGRLRRIAADGSVGPPIDGLPEIAAQGQGGLLDVALGADFARDRTIYFTYAKPVPGGAATAAARATLSEDLTRLEDVEDIFVQQPGLPGGRHFGSRILIGPDGHLYVTTGDRGDPPRAQDMASTVGKVIRLTPDGAIPQDNPFADRTDAGRQVWSIGHRNIQGATFDASGTLWTIEHGPRGGDELNRPEPGQNYGWPQVSYGENYSGSPVGDGQTLAEGTTQPVYYWDPVIAPGGMAFYAGEVFPEWQGDLLIGSLNPGELVRLRLQDGKVVGEERLLRDFARIRDVEVLTDGSVLLAVDFADGALVRLTR